MSNPADKRMTLQEAVLKRIDIAREGKTLVVTNGCFDLLHPGHMYCLMLAAAQGSCLYVLLNSDDSVRQLKGPTRPIITATDRAFQLSCLEFVDGVIMLPTTTCTYQLKSLKPDVYVKGGDYDICGLHPEEKKALDEVHAKIVYVPSLPGYSTTALIEKIQTLNT